MGDSMTLSALLIFAGALIISAGSPGPSIAALVARVISRGTRGVVPFISAMWIGEAMWLASAIFGLAIIAETFFWAFVIIKYCGIAYLSYVAWKMWHAPVKVEERELPDDSSSARLWPVTNAIACMAKGGTPGRISRTWFIGTTHRSSKTSSSPMLPSTPIIWLTTSS